MQDPRIKDARVQINTNMNILRQFGGVREGSAGRGERGRLRQGGEGKRGREIRRLSSQRLHGLEKVARPRSAELAQEVLGRLNLREIAEPLEIAGPGFINVRLKEEWLARLLLERLKDGGSGLDCAEPSKTIVVDFSSPNVAKPMHVGHLRSTVIGDALARILEALGHRTIRDNHLGDWGTQFGMIIWGWKNAPTRPRSKPIPSPNWRLYRLVQARIQGGEKAVEDAARLETVKLHQGEPENRGCWNDSCRLVSKP